MFLICGIVIVILTFFYSPNNRIIKTLDSVVSNRLYYGQEMFKKYGIELWGQEIDEHGAGGSRASKWKYKDEFVNR